MVYYVAVAATGGMVYLRYFRGWRFADMMYVTRGSLKASIGHLSDGVFPPPFHQRRHCLNSRAFMLEHGQETDVVQSARLHVRKDVASSEVKLCGGVVVQGWGLWGTG